MHKRHVDLGWFLGAWVLSVVSAQAATITVTSSADSGAGTLRQAIADSADGGTINFSSSLSGATITLASTLTLAKGLTIAGPGANTLTVSGNNAVRILSITSGTSTILGLTFANGQITSGHGGGGIFLNGGQLTLDQCAVKHCGCSGTIPGGAFGGGIYTEVGALTLNRCVLEDNYLPAGSGDTSFGGAVYASSALEVHNSVFYNNRANLGGACGMNWGVLSNVVICGNYSYQLGALFFNASTTLFNCTISQNTGSYGAGVGFNGVMGTLSLRNTVLAGNVSSNAPEYSDLYSGGATVDSQGYNLIGSAGDSATAYGWYAWTTGDVVGNESAKIPANLGALADNGGYVQTCRPMAGSLVLDPASSNSAPFVDARGYLRVNTADKGAGESVGALPVALPPLTSTSTSFVAYWQEVPGASDYALDVATDNSFSHMVSGLDNVQVGATTCWTVKGLAGQGTYYYRVRAQNGVYKTWHSNTVAVNLAYTPTCTATLTPTCTLAPTATQTPTLQNPLADVDMTGKLFLAYPNPGREQIRFMFNPEHAVRIRIKLFNLSGERAAVVEANLSAGKGTVAWDCRNAAPGLYLAHVEMDGKEIGTAKVAVVR